MTNCTCTWPETCDGSGEPVCQDQNCECHEGGICLGIKPCPGCEYCKPEDEAELARELRTDFGPDSDKEN